MVSYSNFLLIYILADNKIIMGAILRPLINYPIFINFKTVINVLIRTKISYRHTFGYFQTKALRPLFLYINIVNLREFRQEIFFKRIRIYHENCFIGKSKKMLL